MPAYSFRCETKKCKHTFEIFQSISSYNPPKICPKCGKESLVRDYQIDLPTGSIKKSDHEITVGHMAKRNRDNFSDDKKQDLYEKHNSYKWEGRDEMDPKQKARLMDRKKVLSAKPKQRRAKRPK